MFKILREKLCMFQDQIFYHYRSCLNIALNIRETFEYISEKLQTIMMINRKPLLLYAKSKII